MPPRPPRVLPAASLVLGCMAGSGSALAQVNTDALRPAPARAGLGADLDASFTLLGGNVDLLDVGGGGRIQYLSLHPEEPARAGERPPPPLVKHRISLMGNARFTARAGDAIVNQGLLHARWGFSPLPPLMLTVYEQHQFNEFQRLQVRSLWGASLGLPIVNREELNVTLGSGYMLEYNRISVLPGAPDARTTLEHRWGNFLGARLSLLDGELLAQSTLYLQPRFDALYDVRLLEELEVLSRVTTVFFLGATASVLHDSRPPTGVEPTDLRLSTTVKLSF